MKVRLTVNISNAERYVIARYYGESATVPRDQTRPRATRKQVKQFALAAVVTSVKEVSRSLMKKRHRTRASKLLAAADQLPLSTAVAPLPEPAERQLRLTEV